MARNIEIKARVPDWAKANSAARAISDSAPQVLEQRDVFFRTPRGRLKLRWLSPERACLVYYERVDASGPRSSVYHIAETSEPFALQRVLAAALGVRGEVSKVRTLYMVGQTRIHLDRVEGLGEYVELEAVLGPDQSEAEGRASVARLMAALGIEERDLVDVAYIDLLETAAHADSKG